jgi:hypothetical protein
MSTEKMFEIVELYVNGNLSDFRKQIKKLNKIELIELIIYSQEENTGLNNKYHFVGVLKTHLEIIANN